MILNLCSIHCIASWCRHMLMLSHVHYGFLVQIWSNNGAKGCILYESDPSIAVMRKIWALYWHYVYSYCFGGRNFILQRCALQNSCNPSLTSMRGRRTALAAAAANSPAGFTPCLTDDISYAKINRLAPSITAKRYLALPSTVKYNSSTCHWYPASTRSVVEYPYMIFE